MSKKVFDPYFGEAGRVVIKKNMASIGILQRIFKIGFNRAAQIMDQLAKTHVVGEEIGTSPRRVLMNSNDFEQLLKDISNSNDPEIFLETNFLPKDTFQNSFLKAETQFTTTYCLYDGEYLKDFKNILVYKISENQQAEIIDFLFSHNSPDVMRTIIYDNNLLPYRKYNAFPQLLIPVVNDITKLPFLIDWLISERDDRIEKFVSCNATNIDAYNLKQPDNKLPKIIFIIDELFAVQKAPHFEKYITNLLLNNHRLGIYCLFFTKLDFHNLSIKSFLDLLYICDFPEVKKIIGIDPTPRDIPSHAIIHEMDKMDGITFEKFCLNLLIINGFENVQLTSETGDHGIDLLAEKDDITYAIQCKCYASSIGNAAIQQAHTGKSIYHRDIAVVMTNRYFTKQAIEEATALGVKLWDRDKLLSLSKKLNNGNSH